MINYIEIMICNECELPFNPCDLGEVFKHEHTIKEIIETNKIKSLRLINDASEICPNSSRQFCCGVNSYLNGEDMSKLYQEDSDFKNGYWQALDLNLKDYVKLNNKNV